MPPTITNINLTKTFGGTGSTRMDIDYDEIVGVITIAVTTPKLRAGSYQCTVVVQGDPADKMTVHTHTTAFTVSAGQDNTSIVLPAQTYHEYRPLDSAGRVRWNVEILATTPAVRSIAQSFGTDADSSLVLPQAPAPLATPPLFGSNMHVAIPTYRAAGSLQTAIDQAAAQGQAVVRCSLPWTLLEPTNSTPDAALVAQVDSFVNSLAAQGMKWLAILGCVSPTWAAAGGVQYGPPASITTYQNFVDYVLNRWGATIVAVELSNEPNLGAVQANWVPPKYNWTWASFLASQQALYNRVRASTHSATITVLGPALAEGDAYYAGLMYANGFKPYLDGMAIHPYAARFDYAGINHVTGNSWPPDTPWPGEISAVSDQSKQNQLASGIRAVYDVMRANGDAAKQIWVTEYGWSTSQSGFIDAAKTVKAQGGLDTDERSQAVYCNTAVRQVSRMAAVACLLWYSHYDNHALQGGYSSGDEIENWGHNYGFYRGRCDDTYTGREAKPSADTYRHAIAGKGQSMTMIEKMRGGVTGATVSGTAQVG